MQYRCFKISGKYSLPLLGAYLRENQFIGKDGFSRGFFVVFFEEQLHPRMYHSNEANL